MKFSALRGLLRAVSGPPRAGDPGREAWNSERWPRTPRVIRWAWAGGLTVLVVLQMLGYGPQSEAQLLQLVDALVEELQRQERQDRAPAPVAPAGGSMQQGAAAP